VFLYKFADISEEQLSAPYIDTADSSKTSVNDYQIAWRHISEDSIFMSVYGVLF